MENVVRTDIDSQTIQLTFNIPSSQWKPLYEKKISELRRKVDVKGFRKGKAPKSFVLKRFGNSVGNELIVDTLNANIESYLKDNKVKYMGGPIPSQDSEPIDFDYSKTKDFSFKFDLGLEPEFDINDLLKNKFEKYEIEVEDEMAVKALENARSRVATNEETEEPIQEKDIIEVQADELKDKDAWATTFTVEVGEEMNDELKKSLIGKIVGHKFEFDITKMEEGREEDFIRKYLLNVEENDKDVVIGNDFKGEIISVKRAVPAELNQEFFDKVFGEDKVHNEKEALDWIKDDTKKHLKIQEDDIFFYLAKEKMLENLDITLPEDFLKNWLKNSSEQNTDELLNKEFGNFVEQTKWDLVKNKLYEKYEVKPTYEDVKAAWIGNMQQQLGGGANLPPDFLENYADQILKENKEEYTKNFETAMNTKVIEAFSADKDLNINSKTVTTEEFEKVKKELLAKIEARRPKVEAHVHDENCDHEH